jgi:hypothetical protein
MWIGELSALTWTFSFKFKLVVTPEAETAAHFQHPPQGSDTSNGSRKRHVVLAVASKKKKKR